MHISSLGFSSVFKHPPHVAPDEKSITFHDQVFPGSRHKTTEGRRRALCECEGWPLLDVWFVFPMTCRVDYDNIRHRFKYLRPKWCRESWRGASTGLRVPVLELPVSQVCLSAGCLSLTSDSRTELMATRGIERLLGARASWSESFHFQSPSVAVRVPLKGSCALTVKLENFLPPLHRHTAPANKCTIPQWSIARDIVHFPAILPYLVWVLIEWTRAWRNTVCVKEQSNKRLLISHATPNLPHPPTPTPLWKESFVRGVHLEQLCHTCFHVLLDYRAAGPVFEAPLLSLCLCAMHSGN